MQCNLLSVDCGTRYDETAIEKTMECNSHAVGHRVQIEFLIQKNVECLSLSVSNGV